MKTITTAFLIVLITTSIYVALLVDVKYCSGKLRKFTSQSELTAFLETPKKWPASSYLFTSNVQNMRTLDVSGDATEYSQTNVQVQGVDEADIVKTDGEYIYVIAKDKIFIVRAYPPEEATVLSKVVVAGELKQIFINEDRLVAFYENSTHDGIQCVIGVYDVSDRTDPSLQREIKVEGSYVGSRMIGDYTYVLVQEYAGIRESGAILPQICFDGDNRTIPAHEIYFSDITDYSYRYTTIVALNVKDDVEKPAYLTMLLGSSATMYVSTENIYLVISYEGKSILHLIRVENGRISHVADGEVPGTVLNQFSMDEYEGYFRVATTSEMTTWYEPRPMLQNQNNLYVLNMNLAIVGRIEGIAPGEQIHSVRFMDSVCYLVTFRKVDPFFAIDLSNPDSPRIIGELKITGYSDYMHPYDKNHVIGVGKETLAADEGGFSWYQGVKISVFDVTDMSAPKELAKYEIGDRGTQSPVLGDHKAFMFDRERNLLVLPVSVAKINESQYLGGVPANAWGDTVWQGAYVFTVSLVLNEVIAFRGTITHIEDGNVHDGSHYVNRALFIHDVLYTISESKIKMNSLQDLSPIGELSLNV